MNSLNHGNDKIKAPLTDFSDDGNQFDKKKHYLNDLLHRIKLSYEGFYLAKSYAGANITSRHQIEGNIQRDFYIQTFEETLLSLEKLFHQMQAEG